MKTVLAALLAVLVVSQAALAAPALWEARDSDSRILLFGSVHILPPDMDWRTPALDAALAASGQVYFETDIGPRGLTAITVKMLVASFQSAGKAWLHLLSDQDYARLAKVLEPLGVTMETAAVMPPWVLAMQISQQQMTEASDGAASDADFMSGVEWSLQWELPPERKAYLETPGEQFDMIAAGTLDEQVAQLVALLNETGSGTDVLGDLIAAWERGDVDSLMAFMAAKDEADEVALEALLFERNRNWMPALEKLLAENREDLVVVGAAHLAGEGSVLDLLEDAGYTVTRIQ